jgi:hypothetical protein
VPRKPRKFKAVLNLKTTKARGFNFPPMLRAGAVEMID